MDGTCVLEGVNILKQLQSLQGKVVCFSFKHQTFTSRAAVSNQEEGLG